MANEKLTLTAKILNTNTEIEVYDWLRLIIPEYGDKPFNKRFETWLNKQASDRFGIEVYKNWGMNGEDREYPKINFYFRKATWSMNGDKYDLSFNYKGKAVQYDYETKQAKISDKSENEQLIGVDSTASIIEWAERIVINRRENVEQMQSNMTQLPKLVAERDKLKAAIEAYNDKISYTISDTMRIK